MNWYKIAFPLAKTPEHLFYTDVGHGHAGADVKEHDLWIITKGFRLLNASGFDYSVHTGAWKISFIQDNALALGRYVKEDDNDPGMLSIAYNPRLVPINRKDYVRDRILPILDKYYDNPKIMEF